MLFRSVDAYQASARANGAAFLSIKALGIEHSNGAVTGVNTPTGTLPADKVIVASGIWAPAIVEPLIHLPLIPVAHPYVHGATRPVRAKSSPFVRYPEKSVYARDHGDNDGFGSYDHAPLPVSVGASAEMGWEGEFDGAVERAVSLFPEETRRGMRGEGGEEA